MVDLDRRGFLLRGGNLALYGVGMSVSPFLFADAPLLLTVQGRLADSEGAPITGSKTMEFRLLDASGLGIPDGAAWS